ncbi:MAG: FG-GAP-like repeat-containing protein [Luteimonas sp.]
MQVKFLARACAVGLVLASAPALSTFHLMKVVEVFPGTAASPNAQYVVIQMYASGQNLVGGHAITVFNAAGTQTGSFTFPGNLPNGANQAKILIATTQAESFFNLTADLVMSASVLSAGGKVCWAGTLDCVAWGSYHGGSAGVGTPFNASSGLTSGRAAARRLNISGSSTVLDAGDDTDNSANDFVFATPAPRNNAGTLGRIPSATCGNGVIEGLEQCDDHNLNNGDGCSSTCKVEATVVKSHPLGDFNGDGKSDVFWHNTSTFANEIWKSGSSTSKQGASTVASADWKVVGRGDFDGDGKADVLWHNASTGSSSIWRSANSATPLSVSRVSSTNWQVAGIGDFDGNGKADILWRNSSTGSNSIWKSGNSATPMPVAAVSNLAWHVASIGDFNGDGHDDILWRNTSTGSDSIWKSANSATPQAVSGVTDLHWSVVASGDFNGDGKDDLFWRNSTSGVNSIWSAANSAVHLAVKAIADLHWEVAGVGDFNGDGKDDVFWRNYSSGSNSIWRSANSATAQAPGTISTAWIFAPHEGQTIAASSSSSAALSIGSASAAEGNSGNKPMVFTVRLSKAASTAVTYNIATASGSATSGRDFVASSLSGQSIPAGSTSKTFTVMVIGDTAYEGTESFSVHVSGVAGATVASSTATGTITDDDPYTYPGLTTRRR